MNDLAMTPGVSTGQKLPVGAGQKVPFTPQEQKRLQEAASDFEAIFLKQMLTSMRRTIPKNHEGETALVRESEGEKIFRDLLDGEYAKVMSHRSNGLGLKEFIMKNAPGQAAAYAMAKSIKSIPPAEWTTAPTRSNSLNALSQMPIKVEGGGK